MTVQNDFWGTKLFMHNGKESILNTDLDDIEASRKWSPIVVSVNNIPCMQIIQYSFFTIYCNECSMQSEAGKDQSANTTSKIYIGSKLLKHEEFLENFHTGALLPNFWIFIGVLYPSFLELLSLFKRKKDGGISAAESFTRRLLMR